jgi:DNA-binding GntR family transcriptional regulator
MSDLHDNVDSNESMSERIYQQLRAQIITGFLPPGTRLRERELADELGVSRIPLREALPQLEADGFIQSANRRGAIVTELTLRDVEELFDVRLGVEVYATRLAADRVKAGASSDGLRLAMARADSALDAGDVTRITETNADLHEEIVHLAGNSLLENMMRSVSGRDRWIFRMTSNRDPVVACQEHHKLCDAIYAGDADYAAAISYSHIESGRAPTISTLKLVLPP